MFAGNIVALTSITLNTGASVTGSVLARNGAVTLDSNNIARCIEPSAQTDRPLPPTQTAIAATQTAIAATRVAVAPVLTVIAMTPIPQALDESDQPQLPSRLYLQWIGH